MTVIVKPTLTHATPFLNRFHPHSRFLKAAFPLNEGSPRIEDFINRHTGDLVTASPELTPFGGYGVCGTGLGSFADFGDQQIYDDIFDKAVTFTYWMRLQSDPSVNLSIIDKTTNPGPGPGYAIGVSATNEKIRLFVRNSGGSQIVTTNDGESLTVGEWHFVAISHNGPGSGATKRVIRYIDGRQTGTIDTALAPGSTGNAFSFFIRPQDVDLLDMRIYEIELAPTVIRTIYAAGPLAIYRPPVEDIDILVQAGGGGRIIFPSLRPLKPLAGI